jgi:hypothetical protein
MASNNAQLFMKNFSNIDLFRFADPDALKELDIDDIADVSEFKITNGNIKNKCIIPKSGGVDTTTIGLNLSNIKNENPSLYNALIAGDDLGGATFSRDNETTEYSSIDMEMGMKKKGNPASYSDAMLKFYK